MKITEEEFFKQLHSLIKLGVESGISTMTIIGLLEVHKLNLHWSFNQAQNVDFKKLMKDEPK